MTNRTSCPREYLSRSDAELINAIGAIKQREGESLTILGHHYQAADIVRLSDFVGDSFKLCRDAAACQARHIVFCGVRFMAESARVLARPDQIVQHPEATAGCPMADMADIGQVEEAWRTLEAQRSDRRMVPVTYMNSNVDLKAFCGRHGGVVCTSSNASRVFDWAYGRGDTVLFFPDEHLGVNTAEARGMDMERVAVWDPAQVERQTQDARFAQARLVVWKGFCHVHTHFTAEMVARARGEYPGCFVIVHPECPRQVVAASDDAGSTAAIVKRIEAAKAGETIVVGTEINLVRRMAEEHPEVQVVPLAPSLCGNMSKVTLGHLLWTLENLGSAGIVEVDGGIAHEARQALERMLELGG